MKHPLHIFTAISLALMAPTVTRAGAPPPNILLIFADDIGYEALNSYGGLDFETPNLNRMAAQGLRFSRAHTSPVCTPSRVSLHTGLYVPRHGHVSVLPVHLGTDQKVDFQKMPTFARLIRANGSLTSVTGKWQLATLEKHPGHIRDAGFDSWCVWQIWRDGGKTDRHWNATYNQDGRIRDDIAGRFGPDVLVDYVIDRMRAAKAAEKPFLIVHNELLPHWPVVETPDDRRLKREPSLAHFIHYMDQLVGRLLDEVEALGIRDHTYVVFMGDNGTWPADFINPRAGQPGEMPHTRHTTAGNVNGGKNELNDAGSHVPLIVWGPPAVPAGQVCDDLVDVVDLFPTFTELTATGLPASPGIDGRSIAAQIHGKRGIPRAWVHHALAERLGGECLFDGSFRLFRKSGKLIDARALPQEKAADAADPEAVAAKAALEAVFRKITPAGPRPPDPFVASGGESWRERLYTPTQITKLGDTWFMVVCWQHRILFHDGPEPDPDLSKWQVMDEALAGPHSITTDGELYVVDDTGRHGLKTYRRRSAADGGGFEHMQSIEGLGRRTHRVHYCAASKAFHVLSSNSQDLHKFVRDGRHLKLESRRQLGFLEGSYTRSFTLHDGHMFFTAGPAIIKVRYLDNSYEVVARYPVPGSLAGMNDVFPASDGWWYVTATPQAIVRTRDLAMLADGAFEDLQKPLGFQGTPYYLFEHDGRLWIPQITQHSGIVSFKLDPDGGEPTDRRVLFDSGPPTAADLERMKALPR